MAKTMNSDMVAMARAFLRMRGAYDAFMANYKERGHKEAFTNWVKGTGIGMIDGAFVWAKTKEGFGYWNVLDMNWRCICEMCGIVE